MTKRPENDAETEILDRMKETKEETKMIKQLYSIIQLDEAIKTMEAGADNIGLVPSRWVGCLLTGCRCIGLIRFMKNVGCAESRWS